MWSHLCVAACSHSAMRVPRLNSPQCQIGSECSGWGTYGGGREVGWVGRGGGSDPTYLQSNNKHTRNNQCKILMGNIIVCPKGQKQVNTKGTHCRFGIAGNLGVVLAWLTSVSTLQRTNGEGTTWLRSGPKKVDFIYTNIPPKSHFSIFF